MAFHRTLGIGRRLNTIASVESKPQDGLPGLFDGHGPQQINHAPILAGTRPFSFMVAVSETRPCSWVILHGNQTRSARPSCDSSCGRSYTKDSRPRYSGGGLQFAGIQQKVRKVGAKTFPSARS